MFTSFIALQELLGGVAYPNPCPKTEKPQFAFTLLSLSQSPMPQTPIIQFPFDESPTPILILFNQHHGSYPKFPSKSSSFFSSTKTIASSLVSFPFYLLFLQYFGTHGRSPNYKREKKKQIHLPLRPHDRWKPSLS